MKTFKKFFMVALSVLASAMLMLCVTACTIVTPPSSNGNGEDAEIRKVYATYVAYAEERGETPLSYEEWLASIKGEKGDQGDKGDQGETGPQGPQGEQGLSAYEIWLEQGHVGTEEDFLNWLKGENEQSCAHEFGAWVCLSADDVAPQDKLYFRTCSLCKEVEWRQGVDAIEHSWVTTVVAPTCLGQGYDLLTCTLCGATKKTNFVAVADHNWVSITVESSCQSQGYTETKCTSCGESHITDVVANAHSWVISSVAATCHSQGYILKKCSKCGVEEKSNFTDTIDHTFETTYSYNSTFHWFNCANCSATKDKVEHTEGDDGSCTICGVLVANTEGVLYDLDASGEFAVVIGYEGTAKAVKIAEAYNGVPVTQICEKAFYYNDTITSVIIPDSVTTIGSSAFYYCTSLTSVVIGDSVTSIGSDAFESCSSLTSVVIGDSVTSIGYEAFYYCYSLTSVEIPDSVTSIGVRAFSNCYRLTSVVMPASGTSISFEAFKGCNKVIIEYENCKYLSSANNPYYALIEVVNKNYSTYTIHSDTVVIAYRAFYGCSRMANIVIPESVTTIGEYAFSYCDSLTSVVIGDSVTTIGEGAFYESYSLTKVYYKGTAEDWAKIVIASYGNSSLTSSTKRYYSESEPTTTGNYWHYDEEGNPVAW